MLQFTQPHPLSVYSSFQVKCVSPSHSESPYTGRWCTPWGRPDSLQSTIGFPASPLQHTGYSASAPSPQTAVCQSEMHENIKKDPRVKIIRQGTEPGVYLDSSVWVLSASVGIFKWKLVLLAPDRFLPFFPSLDKWGAEFSWTGHTSGECWASFLHWKHLLELLGCLGHMLCECFHLITDGAYALRAGHTQWQSRKESWWFLHLQRHRHTFNKIKTHLCCSADYAQLSGRQTGW